MIQASAQTGVAARHAAALLLRTRVLRVRHRPLAETLRRSSLTLATCASISLLGSCHKADSSLSQLKPLQPPAGVVSVQVVHTSKGYELLRGGKPYFIKGGAGLQYFDLMRQKGGNSVRIYTARYADVMLDAAQQQGLTVMFGLWMKPPYEKFDYYDPKAVEAQKQAVYREVQRYKNHPALLMWNLGNELDNHIGDFKVYQIVNETAQMIHKLDPNHPVTTTITQGILPIPAIAQLCPDIDVLTVNVFGNLITQPQRLLDRGWSGPYIIGEFGGQGWWESPQTSWNAPLDQSSSVKAELIARGYQATINGNRAHCLGSYVLYWGNRFEQTDMWLSMFGPNGEKTPMVDMMQYLWTGKNASNQAPTLGPISIAHQLDIDNVSLRPNTDYPAALSAFDPDGDSLYVEWKITHDVDEVHTLPQNRTAPEVIPTAIREAKGMRAVVHTPSQRGAYRLLANVYDGKGSVTSNSFPFFVDSLALLK
jgi:hypothetical protein